LTPIPPIRGSIFHADSHCDLLSPVYDWFTEGFDTPALKDARTLLDELS
jgi:hypothetical protein